MTGVCVVPPNILFPEGSTYAMVVYDTIGSQVGWNGIIVTVDSKGPVKSLLKVRQGDIVVMTGVVDEIPTEDMNSMTIFKCLSITTVDSFHLTPKPILVSLSDFYRGSYPTGQVKYSTGEQYEGMYVELHDLRVYSEVSAMEGSLNLVDTAGNTLSTSDVSKWFTLGRHRDASSTYTPPVSARIDTIRGIIVTSGDSLHSNGSYGYRKIGRAHV